MSIHKWSSKNILINVWFWDKKSGIRAGSQHFLSEELGNPRKKQSLVLGLSFLTFILEILFTLFTLTSKSMWFSMRKTHLMQLKGGEAKTRPHETHTNANFKVLYRNKWYVLTTSVYWLNNFFELIQNTVCMDVEK